MKHPTQALNRLTITGKMNELKTFVEENTTETREDNITDCLDLNKLIPTNNLTTEQKINKWGTEKIIKLYDHHGWRTLNHKTIFLDFYTTDTPPFEWLKKATFYYPLLKFELHTINPEIGETHHITTSKGIHFIYTNLSNKFTKLKNFTLKLAPNYPKHNTTEQHKYEKKCQHKSTQLLGKTNTQLLNKTGWFTQQLTSYHENITP